MHARSSFGKFEIVKSKGNFATNLLLKLSFTESSTKR